VTSDSPTARPIITPAATIRALRADDWPAVERIFAEGISAGNATFESATPTWEQFDAGKVPAPRLVAVDGDEVVGWAAASPVSSRSAYRGVIEHSVYVASRAQGRGIGRALLDAFIDAADAAGYWTIQSSVFPENAASLALHERVGFRVIGRREAIAQSAVGPHAGQWRDTILIERRRDIHPRPEASAGA
jgi:L-amino acid N-acyltransferase YncA